MSKTNGKKNGKIPEPTPIAGDSVERDANGRLKPGSVLNPRGGRTAYAATVYKEWKDLLSSDVIDDAQKRTKLRLLLDEVFARAIDGDMVAAKIILDRVCPATLQIDANITGMEAGRVLDVFDCMQADYVSKGRLPDLTDRS